MKKSQFIHAYIEIEKPDENIEEFEGKFVYEGDMQLKESQPLDLYNTLWTSTVLASDSILVLVCYTGKEVRINMASKGARQKTPRIDNERNLFAKLLFSFLFGLSVILIIMKGFMAYWYTVLIRYLLLMSSIIPMSI